MTTMRRFIPFAVGGLALCTSGLVGFRSLQTPQIDRKQLKDMLGQLGYEVKDLDTTAGKEKYSVTVTKSGLDIPIAFEISANGSYIWLTVNLGAMPDASSPKNQALLQKNSDIQPAQFYFSNSKKMMMAMPIENRDVTNALLRQRTDTVTDDVTGSKDVWQ